MKFKTWGADNLSVNDVFDGSTEYNIIEGYIDNDVVNPTDLSRPVKNMFSNQDEIYKLLSSITNTSVNKGVIRNNITGNFLPVFQSVTLDTVTKDYTFLGTGVAYNNGYTIVNVPQVFTASRQIENILHLDTSEGESCNITYNKDTLTYSCVIKKIDGTGAIVDYNFLNLANSVLLLEAIYNTVDFVSYFNTSINRDLTKIKLEETLYELIVDDTYTWKINLSGDIILDNVAEIDTDIKLQSVVYDSTAHTGTYNDYTNVQFSIKNYNEYNNNLFLNVGDSPDFDSRAITDPLDYTIDYTSMIGNKNTFLVFMRGGNGSELENAVFGWSEDGVDTIDKYPDPISNSNVFYMNKDLVVRYGPNSGDIESFATVVANASSSVSSVATYNDLPGGQPDGSVYFVRYDNKFYRYSSSTSTWIGVSNANNSYNGVTQVKVATDFEAGGTDYTIYKFSSVFKVDGSSIEVFVNGIHQDLGVGAGFDYTILDEQTIVFNDALDADPTNTYITLRFIQGGENYYPENRSYVIGTAKDVYTGGTSLIETDFHVMKTRSDVFLSGMILAESVLIDTIGSNGLGTVTSASDESHLTDSAEDFTGMEDYFIIFTSTDDIANRYEVRRISSVTTDTITLDSALPSTLVAGDTYEIYEDYDYFVNENKDRIYLSDPATIGEVIQVRDRASIVSSYETMAAGASLPAEGIFGQEYYVDPFWYKWNGSNWDVMNTGTNSYLTLKSTTERDLMAASLGMIIFNTTQDRMNVYADNSGSPRWEYPDGTDAT